MYPNQTITVKREFNHVVSCLAMAGLLLLLSSLYANAQVQDTSSATNLIHKHAPRKAIMYSMICPGLGQAYNNKYWKLPIIYGAGGFFAYFIGYNQLKYKKFRDANANGKDTQASAIIDGVTYEYAILDRAQNYYRRYRDLSIFGLGAIYFLNVVDAMVDATFYYYDVTDDLSMRIEPALIEGPGMTAAIGFRINLGF